METRLEPSEKEKLAALETAVNLCVENPGLYEKAYNEQARFSNEKEKFRCLLLRYIVRTYPNVRHMLNYYSQREQWC